MFQLSIGAFITLLILSTLLLLPVCWRVLERDRQKGFSLGRTFFKVAALAWVYVSLLILVMAPLPLPLKLVVIVISFLMFNLYAAIGYYGAKHR
jgi:hypothetical protein